jgi:hypothetical protein
VGAAPRQLHLESQGSNHRVYFNGVLMFSYTDSTYAAGQPGIAASFSGGITVKVLSFTGGTLAGVSDTVPPVLSGGQPAGALGSGTNQTTLSLNTNESATCRYATAAGVAYGSMTNVFTSTGGTTHSTVVTGLVDGSSYSYYVRCQDTAGNADSGDFLIAFAVGTASGNGSNGASSFSGVEDPLSENGMWGAAGSWTSLKKNNGAYSTSVTSAARLLTPLVSADQYAEITYDQDPGSSSWPGVMTRVSGAANGSGYLAIVCAGQVRLYRTDDTVALSFSLLASADVNAGAAPRRLRLESQGPNHRVYFNGVLVLSYTDSANVYATGQPGIASSFSGGTTVRILSFIGGSLAGVADTAAPSLSAGQPTGTLPSGTTQTTLSVTTNENAVCRYATTAGVPYGSMANVFTTTGGTTHSTLVTGLADGGSYSYYVRCQDSSGNTDSSDFVISFAVTIDSNGTITSSFSGVEDPLSENGMWGTTGSWTSLEKNSGAYSTAASSAARLVTPSVSADQYAEITYDQDPGSSSWPGVMTRLQGASNGGGYLAIAFAGQVRLYRTDDSGTLNFVLLASANADVGAAPRQLRLESQGASHRVYFNGALMFSYTDSNNVYTTGQPGIAASFSGGTTVRILSFTGGALAGAPDTVPPVLSGGLPAGMLAPGTTQTTLSLTTNESAACRYATTAGMSYGSMTNIFTSTGGTAHSTVVTGLVDGGSYSYYVRCQDSAGNTDSGDFLIAFAAGTAAGNGGNAASFFSGVEDPLSENGMWGMAGAWSSLKKNNGVYSTSVTSAARLVTPVVSADQYAEITWDQDPGASSWPGAMTRVQGAANGGGYLAIVCAGQVLLYRADDSGTLSFSLLASASVDAGAAPRRLRLESQGANHRVYVNGTLMLSYTDSGNVYTTGQPGIASSFSGGTTSSGTTVRILSFTGGVLPGN